MSTRIKSTVIKAIDTFTGHGIVNIFAAESLLGKIVWSFFVIIFSILCGYYIYNSLAGFFKYEVLSNVKVFDLPELTFPAVILCSVFSNNSIKDMIVYCTFNRQNCLSNKIDFEPIIIIGGGISAQHDCIRINGLKVSEKNKSALLSVKQKSIYTSGLSIGFSIPENVLKIFANFINFKIKNFFL